MTLTWLHGYRLSVASPGHMAEVASGWRQLTPHRAIGVAQHAKTPSLSQLASPEWRQGHFIGFQGHFIGLQGYPQSRTCGTGGHGPKSLARAEVFWGAKSDDLTALGMWLLVTRWLFQQSWVGAP